MFLVTLVVPASGGDGEIDISTGVSPDGTLIPVGSNDDTYVLVAGPPGTGSYPAPAVVANPHSAWNTFPDTRWVSRNASATGPNGLYTYETQFAIPSNAINPNLTGLARSDNNATITLNGIEIAQLSFTSYSGPGVSIDTSDPSLFVIGGINTLQVDVFEGGVVTGLNVQSDITFVIDSAAPVNNLAPARVPVFNGWWLLMGILLSLFLILRRIRRS